MNFNELNQATRDVQPNEIVGIDDAALVRRMNAVLRFKHGDQFVLFDMESNYSLFEVVAIDKRLIKARLLPFNNDIQSQQLIEQRKRFNVTASICMTKARETFEEMITQCAAMGVNRIVPILMEKKQLEYFDNKKERLEKLMVAAVEQSKNFYGMPLIESPLTIQEYMETLGNADSTRDCRVFLDVEGEKSWISLLDTIEGKKDQGLNVNIMVGPERDLFDAERVFIKEKGFQPMSLSKKIVYKSEVALTVSLGSIMSVIWN